VLVHLADTLYVVEGTSVKSLIYLLFNNEILTTSLCVRFGIDRWRSGDDMRYLFASDRVENMYIQDTRSSVIPVVVIERVFVYVLNCAVG